MANPALDRVVELGGQRERVRVFGRKGFGDLEDEAVRRAIGTEPQEVVNGPKVALLNHWSASDGDIFPYLFKQYGLGKLVGTRSWGGVRGIRGDIPLIDGGYITRPEASRYDLNSKWVVENRGVQPDVVVENRPDLVVKGQDPQLEKAIELVMKEIQSNPKKLAPRPPDLPTYPEGPGM